MFGCDCCCVSSLVYLVGLLTVASKVIPFIIKKFSGRRPIELQEKAYKKDVVYLYQVCIFFALLISEAIYSLPFPFPGSATASSLSPFCIKIEAFCRLHGIKIERRSTYYARGSNNQLPFIELNGESYADSQIILRRLTQIFKLKAYPDEQTAAVGHAVDRLLDNHTFNLVLMTNQSGTSKMAEFMVADQLPSLLVPVAAWIGGRLFAAMYHKRATTSVGTFKANEYDELLRNDLLQLQTILGEKKFLLADEPTLVDCTALGHWGHANAIPAAKIHFHSMIDQAEFAPLKEYFQRVTTRIFGNEFCDKK